VTLPFITALCPTFRKPICLANSLACWLAQDYPLDRRELLIHDSAHQFASQQGTSWRLRRLDVRPNSLPDKYNAMVGDSDPRTDLYIVWDDDDVYLPRHCINHVAALSLRGQPVRSGWSKPRSVLSTYTRKPLVEAADGRFHGSIAIGADLMEIIQRWPQTRRADFDQRMLWTLASVMPPADPIEINQTPSYVFRWGTTSTYHSQHVMRSPDDETWYDRVPEISHAGNGEPMILSPLMDSETAALYDEFSQ